MHDLQYLATKRWSDNDSRGYRKGRRCQRERAHDAGSRFQGPYKVEMRLGADGGQGDCDGESAFPAVGQHDVAAVPPDDVAGDSHAEADAAGI